MSVFGRFFFLVSGLLCLVPAPLWAAEAQQREKCGEYTFELPPGFELRHLEIDTPKFDPTLVLNSPFRQQDLTAATIICVREKKHQYQSFSLPYKEKIHVLTAANKRNYVQLFVSAVENTLHDGIRIKFNLVEENSSNTREIRGWERFMVAIEMDATNEAWHTTVFISDFRKHDGFFDVDEYKSQVTGIAAHLMDSIAKSLQ